MTVASTRVVRLQTPPRSSLTVHVYTDANANGVEDIGDKNLAGVTVRLLNGDGTATGETALTDARGNVTFSGLNPGSYQVSVSPQAGTAVSQKVNVLKPVVLAAGKTANAVEGVYLPARFTAHVYADANGNGVQDAGESNLAGVIVRLLNGDGTATGKAALTDAGGNVAFTGLKPGMYEVSVAAPAGNTATQKTNVLKPIMLASGATVSALEGAYSPARFSAHVYTDANANGVQDASEKSLGGVTVRLLNGDGSATGKSALTDAGGNVTFRELRPGKYKASIVLPAGDIATQQTNLLAPITLASGGRANAIQGVYAPASITAHVYLDANGNGSQDAGEANLAGVVVNLLNGDGTTPRGTALTDAGGNVTFSGFRPSKYQVSVLPPTGNVPTQQTNLLTPITLVSGGKANAIEGVYASATITTHVYTDANANGTQDAGENNLAGVTVRLLNEDGTVAEAAAVTDASGTATFAGLRPDSYEVSVTPPVGATALQQTNVLTPIELTSGGTANAIAGVYAPASLTGHVYTDANANGTQDGGDTNLAGVTVSLLNGDGTAVWASAVTDAAGNVTFSGLKPGDYEVLVTSPEDDTAAQQINILTPITLTSGGTAAAVEGISARSPAAALREAAVAAGANADVGLLAVGAPGYAADARVLTVGIDKDYQTIASAINASEDGDVILVDSGTYTNDFAVVNTRISLIAVGGRVSMNATVPPPNLKGILTQEADLTVIGFDFTNCRIPDADGHNGAGIRVDFGNLTLINDRFAGNQDGLLTNTGTESIVIDHCLFEDNGGADGNGAGNIHNVYIGAIASVTVTNSVFQNAQVGHEFKSRAAVNTLTNNVFVSGVGSGTGSYNIDLPDGGKAILKNNTIIKGPNAENDNMVHFGGEGIPSGGSSLLLEANLFRATNPSAVGLMNQTAITATVTGNVLDGLDAAHFIRGPATATSNYDVSGVALQDATSAGVLPGATMIITDANPHTVVMQGNQILAVEGGAGLLTLVVQVGHIVAIGGSGGMNVMETAGLTGGNQYTTAAGSVNRLNLAGLGMNSIDSEGTDTIFAGDGNETGVINGHAAITGGAGDSQWSVNGTASIYTGTGSASITLGSAASLVITGTNDFFALNANGGTATWNTVNAGAAVAGSVSGGALSMRVYAGCANVTTASGGDGVVLHLDQGDANVQSVGADTVFAGAGYCNIIVSGAAKVYAGTGRLEVYGRSNSIGAEVHGNGGNYLFGGDTGNITYYGGDKASTVEAKLDNITLIGGGGLLTINGGSRDRVVGGAGGIAYHDFGGGANTVTTLVGSANLLEISGSDQIDSYGHDTIKHRDGNSTINIFGNSSLWIGGGASHVYLAGNDAVTVAQNSASNNWFTVASGANVSFNLDSNNWIHDAGGTATVSIANSVVSVAGGIADLYADRTAGVSVTTDGSGPVAIATDGLVSIKSNGADIIHLGAGVASVLASADGAQIWGGSGIASVSGGASSDTTTVHGGSGSMSVTGGLGVIRFIGGSGSAAVLGTYGSLDVAGGAGDVKIGWSSQYGGTTNFVAGSGTATVSLGAQGGRVQFGTGDTTVSGADWAHATKYVFLAGQSGTDVVSKFVLGWDKIELGAGVSVVSHDVVGGSAHCMFSSGAHATFSGISDINRLFG